jgi:hypothetical protein
VGVNVDLFHRFHKDTSLFSCLYYIKPFFFLQEGKRKAVLLLKKKKKGFIIKG